MTAKADRAFPNPMPDDNPGRFAGVLALFLPGIFLLGLVGQDN